MTGRTDRPIVCASIGARLRWPNSRKIEACTALERVKHRRKIFKRRPRRRLDSFYGTMAAVLFHSILNSGTILEREIGYELPVGRRRKIKRKIPIS